MHTVAEVARRLSVSVSMVYGLIQRGQLNFYRVGRCIRVTTEQIDEYLDQSKGKNGSPKTQTSKLRHINL